MTTLSKIVLRKDSSRYINVYDFEVGLTRYNTVLRF